MTDNIAYKIANSNKLLRIVLDGSPEIYTAISYKDLITAIRNREKFIVTPLPTAIDNDWVLLGYRVEIQSGDKTMCLNDMLLGKSLGPNDKEIRLSHNAEKLFLSGVYDIETKWE